MPRLDDLPEIVSGTLAAETLGKSVWWLWRRRQTPIYKPNSGGKYPRRQVELIADVEAGTHTADHAYSILQAERDAKKAQGALTLAKSRKQRGRA